MDSISNKTVRHKNSQSQLLNSPSTSTASHLNQNEKNSYFTLPLDGHSSYQGNFSFAEPISDGRASTAPKPDSKHGRNGVALGKIAEKCEPFKNQGLTSECFLQFNSDTGEVKVYKHGKNGTIREQKDRTTARLEKWELLDCAQAILTDHRTRFCFRHRIESEVGIVQSKDTCRYTGLVVCASSWGFV